MDHRPRVHACSSLPSSAGTQHRRGGVFDRGHVAVEEWRVQAESSPGLGMVDIVSVGSKLSVQRRRYPDVGESTSRTWECPKRERDQTLPNARFSSLSPTRTQAQALSCTSRLEAQIFDQCSLAADYTHTCTSETWRLRFCHRRYITASRRSAFD